MFPEGRLLPLGLWCGAAVLLAAYVLLFLLARRPVGLRPARLGWTLPIVLALRLALLALGYPLDGPLEWALAGLALAGAAGLCSCARVLLVRTEQESLRRQIEEACEGLFLKCAEAAPGRFLLTEKAGTRPLRTGRIARRLQWLVLPRPAGAGKTALMVDWLSKQYPGPVPRIHIVLKRRA